VQKLIPERQELTKLTTFIPLRRWSTGLRAYIWQIYLDQTQSSTLKLLYKEKKEYIKLLIDTNLLNSNFLFWF